jgi:hypothetical protein
LAAALLFRAIPNRGLPALSIRSFGWVGER